MRPPPYPSPFQGRAIAYDTTFRFVIPAERRQAREPGPKNRCLALISECRDTWVPDRLASLAVRDDKPKGCKKVICDCPALKGPERGMSARSAGWGSICNRCTEGDSIIAAALP